MGTNFNEKAFLYALASRPEDAKRFATMFKPDWLHTTEYIPILAELFAFTRKHGEQPSIDTLHTVFKDKDEDAYELRYKAALESITDDIPDRSTQLYVLDKARDTGVVRDFQDLTNDSSFLRDQAELEGSHILKALHTFFNRHGDASDIRTMDLKEAVEHLMDTSGFEEKLQRIECGIDVIDRWTAGGLRTKQLGIIMAPTGDGKSAMLVNMAHAMAVGAGQHNVWLVTNELSIEEQTERILAKLTGHDITRIIDAPGIAYAKTLRHWRSGVHERLRVTEVNREVSTDELEAEMMKWSNLVGWKPKVLVLDFIERMKPNEAGYGRDKEWNWLGAISRDLSRLAKRHNMLIWTAAQTNRSGYGRANQTKGKQNQPDPLSLEMAQASVKHLQEAAVIIGMRQRELNDDLIVMELADLKQRFAKRQSRSVFLECDLSRMNITNTEVEQETYVKPVETEPDEIVSSKPEVKTEREQQVIDQKKKR